MWTAEEQKRGLTVHQKQPSASKAFAGNRVRGETVRHGEEVGGGGLLTHTDSVTGVCVGVEGNADCLPSLILPGPYNRAHPVFMEKDRPRLRLFMKPYKEATNLHQREFGSGSGGGMQKG